jgi:hypothetical protein
MDLSLLWQYLVIGLAVLLSLAVVVRKRAPGWSAACGLHWPCGCCALAGLPGCNGWGAG